jgi:hypothetical protein
VRRRRGPCAAHAERRACLSTGRAPTCAPLPDLGAVADDGGSVGVRCTRQPTGPAGASADERPSESAGAARSAARAARLPGRLEDVQKVLTDWRPEMLSRHG